MKILITGTNRGLGQVLANTLYKQGHEIFSLSRKHIPNTYESYRVDISDDKAIKRIVPNLKNIDILINNAGVINFKPIGKYTKVDILRTLNTNVLGTMLLTQEVIKCMRKRKHGYIINIGSTRSITSAPNKSLYSMSKFALRSFTQSINLEFNKYGIYSTLVCPGRIDNENKDKVHYEDIVITINYLISMPMRAKIPEIIIGGVL